MQIRSAASNRTFLNSKSGPHRILCHASSVHATNINNGLQTSPIINGCWQLAGGHGREVFEDITLKLAAHAEAGLTTFDTADIYGPSEGILGEFQARWHDSGKTPLQIITKYVPNVFQATPSPSTVDAAVRKSMKNLQMESLDLVQLHWWDYSIPGMVDVALALADLREKGLVKNVGLTNMDVPAVSKIVDAGVTVSSNQVQFSLLDRRPLNGMVQFCKEHDIKILAYGSVGGGLLSDKYAEEAKKSWFGSNKYSSVDLNTSSLKMYWNVVKEFGGQELWRELLQVLQGIAMKHSVTTANVAVRWIIQQGPVLPIIGLRNTSHIIDNKAVLAFQLDNSDLLAIQEVLSRSSGPAGDIYSFERRR
ncbi:hypothetical protein CEUSTIGMA_g7117.t1 [Chlamydomonas eustigma]|uniref:NADP-dependent oxidoreductase domain-containing protein n=1 Tax=Chlamydomonas eustigma TaxID=1157962 RepID=A0A250X9D5_9CHLO|nr:hypothetical protein CEUSTIGMA_g7117.t1 [Chlamydomonas eustigma]|eukprot:GAX79676.1 hypothetical protein CEUSTIGMA_g7117.t1 [Chlamydomonas eustigma]